MCFLNRHSLRRRCAGGPSNGMLTPFGQFLGRFLNRLFAGQLGFYRTAPNGTFGRFGFAKCKIPSAGILTAGSNANNGHLITPLKCVC